MPRQLPAANWSQAGIRRLGCLQRQVLRLQEPLAKPSWRAGRRPKQSEEAVPLIRVNVCFATLQRAAAVKQQRSLNEMTMLFNHVPPLFYVDPARIKRDSRSA
jgi:hypothetical protein